MVKITSRKELEDWLDDKPKDWAQVIAARAALRVLPIALYDDEISKDSNSILGLFRASIIAWMAQIVQSDDIIDTAFFASKMGGNHMMETASSLAAYSIAANAYSPSSDTSEIAASAINSATIIATQNTLDPKANSRQYTYNAGSIAWATIEFDAYELERKNVTNPSALITTKALWSSEKGPSFIKSHWNAVKVELNYHNPEFINWIDWYERRLAGKKSAFDIPHDIDRTEDKAILIRLADATNEEFWDKGAEYVNAQLGEWLREARQRAQERYEQENDGIDKDVLDEENMPSQETSVTSFAPRDDGKIDRAPATPDNRLRDIPDARQSYADLRNKVKKLRQEGQRLGGNLKEALDDFLSSLPEDFEQALAYNIWRDGTNLREIFELHELAIQSPDYDPDKLENAIALRLKGVLSLFNNFAFDDDGLRQRDERIPPQKEVQNAVQEARIAQPIINTAQKENALSTQQVLDDLKALAKTEEILKDQDIPDNIYQKQELVENNKVTRNFVTALITVARGVLKEVKKSASNIRDGAEKELGKTLVKTSKYLVILEYIKRNASELKQFVITAYTNPTLVKLIDDVVELVSKSF